MEEKQNKNLKKKSFKKRLIIFLAVLIFSWVSFSQADLTGGNIFQDTDGDGLYDFEEETWGTDPNNPDTDGDGYMDGVEVKSGYYPLKPAPGDKIIIEETVVAGEAVGEEEISGNNTETEDVGEGDNLTEDFLTKLEEQKSKELDLLKEISSDPSVVADEDTLEELQSASITSTDVENIFKEQLNSVNVIDEMEMFSEEDLFIMDEVKEEDEEKKKAIEKKQIEEYIAQAGFLLVTNSPFELDESKELTTLAVSFISDISGYVDMGNEKKLKEYRDQARIILDKLKELKAPYVMKDLHITSLSLFNYLINSVEEKSLIDKNDPIEMMLSLGRLQGVMGEFENLKIKTETLLEEYGIGAIGITEELAD